MRIKINGKDCNFFSDLNLDRKLDSIASTFSFKVRFNGENDDHKELFRPLSYFPVEIFNSKNKIIFTGTILNHAFESNSVNNLLTLSGYSKSGILEDVTIPPSQYPLESNSRSLKEIVSRLCGFYGLKLIINDNVSNIANSSFKKTTASISDTVKSYISKLTAQKNILLSHNEYGDLVMLKPNENAKPKYYFNVENTLSMSSSFNGQSMHSEINVVRQPSNENSGSSTVDKITNPLISVFRPTTNTLTSGDDVDVLKAADNQLAAELKNISVKVKLFGLFDDINPGDIVNIHNHEIYSFAYVNYMVSSISLNESVDQSTTDLELVLPETFTGNQPKNIFFAYKTHKKHI